MWFRGIFFSWVLSRRRESKLLLGWEPASYMKREEPVRVRDEASLEHDYLLSLLAGNKDNRAKFSGLLGPPAGRQI